MRKYIVPFFFLMLFRIALDQSYIEIVAPLFSRFFPLDISVFKMCESYLLTIAFFALIISWFPELKRPSYAVVYILYLNLLVPMFSFYALANGPRTYTYMAALSLFIVILIVRFGSLIKIKYLKQGPFITVFLVATLTTFVFSYLLITGGLSRFNFSLVDVYETRSAYEGSSNFFMGYLLPSQAYSVNMMVLAYALYRQKRFLTLLTIFSQVCLFAMSGFKSFLFAPLLILLFHYVLNKRKSTRIISAITFVFLTSILYSAYTFFIKNDILTASIFLRRLLFVPAQLHYLYYDFFQENPHVMLSNSIFSGFISYPYGDTSILHAISQTYYGMNMGINVGYIGNAYMHFGLIGVFLFSVLLGFILKCLDSISARIPVFVSTSVIIIPSMALVNSALLTVLLTHGLLFAMFLLWMIGGSFEKERRAQHIYTSIAPKAFHVPGVPAATQTQPILAEAAGAAL